MKTKKYVVIGTILLMVFTMLSINASAHPPRYMNLQYEPENLKVVILHFSFAPFNLHYVYKVDIEKNGELIETELYERQPRFIIFSYTYNVTAEPGDELTVDAACVLFGSITRSITV